jgi:hypothetical protein
MVPIMSLWIPILLSAVVVFIASAILHMVLPVHKSDWKKVEKEDDLLDTLRKIGITPGDYMVPCGGGYEAMKDPVFVEKWKRGPIALMTIVPSGMGMGKSLFLWFLYCILVGVFAAYLTGRAFGPGTVYMTVFRYAGTTAFLGYSLALLHDSIWYHRKWSTTLKHLIDGLIYALLTAGVFGWLWPGR